MSGGGLYVENDSSYTVMGSGELRCTAPILLYIGTTYSTCETQAFETDGGLSVGDEYKIQIDWTNYPTGRFRFQYEIWPDSSGENVDYYVSWALRGSETSGSYEFRKSSRIGGVWATGAEEANNDSYSSVTNPFDEIFYIYVKKETTSTTSFTIKESDDDTVFFTETYTDADDSLLGDVNRIGFTLNGSGPGNSEGCWTITRLS